MDEEIWEGTHMSGKKKRKKEMIMDDE